MRNVRTKRVLLLCGSLLVSCLLVTNFYASELVVTDASYSAGIPLETSEAVREELEPGKDARRSRRTAIDRSYEGPTSGTATFTEFALRSEETTAVPSRSSAANLGSRRPRSSSSRGPWLDFPKVRPNDDTSSLYLHYRVQQSLNRTNAISLSNDESARIIAIWPEDSDASNDRILAQLSYAPPSYNHRTKKKRQRTKKIYVPAGLGDVPPGRKRFIQDGCTVDACSLTSEGRFQSTADLVLFQIDAFFDVPPKKASGQIWMLWLLESPLNTPEFRHMQDVINWTATYRSDSTIVTPYEKFVLKAPPLGAREQRPRVNYAKGKSKMVAWFVSNCLAGNGRWEYLLELRQYVPVDVFGACGDKVCQRDDETECDKMLRRDYKFYLSFENSNCEYYITEKFFQRSLWNDVVPIVMGARRQDYAAVAPPHSYIHVEDFPTPRHLANHLLRLNSSDRLYNEHFAWKEHGSFVNTKFWCRLCALLHDDTGHVSWYADVEKWWRRNGVCTRDRWDDRKSVIANWTEYYNGKAREP